MQCPHKLDTVHIHTHTNTVAKTERKKKNRHEWCDLNRLSGEKNRRQYHDNMVKQSCWFEGGYRTHSCSPQIKRLPASDNGSPSTDLHLVMSITPNQKLTIPYWIHNHRRAVITIRDLERICCHNSISGWQSTLICTDVPALLMIM